MSTPRSFRSAEAATFWRYTESSISRLVALVVECPADVVRWEPPADAANSILALGSHTLANAEENLCGVVLGQTVKRQREVEFAPDRLTPGAVAQAWATLSERIGAGLAVLAMDEMARSVSHPRRGEIAVRAVMLVVARHAAEHLGQAELTRDLAMSALRHR